MALTGSTIASTYLKLLRITNDTMGADATAYYIQDSADTDSALSISTTRVGIGTDAPAKPLHISSSDNQPLRVESTDAYAGIQLKDNGSSTLPPLISALSDDLLFYGGHASSQPLMMYLDSSTGNVGINESSPSQKLDIGAGHILLDNGYGLYFGDTNCGINGRTDTDKIEFATSNSVKMTLDASGNVEINTGNLKIGTAGKGINFDAYATSGNPSSNLLDDYEEGTWTPDISLGHTGVPATREGYYTKIGRVVTVDGYIDVGGVGSVTGSTLQLTLPFATISSNNTDYAGTFHMNVIECASNGDNVFFRASEGLASGYCNRQIATGRAAFTGNHLGVNGIIRYSLTYMTA